MHQLRGRGWGNWELCEACGARQPVEVAAIGQAAGEGGGGPTGSAAVGSTPLAGLGLRTPAATYFFVIGGVFILAGIIYLLATAGFPPSTTTTYEFHPDGSTSTSTSPDAVEIIVTVGLFLIGAVLMRASQAANSPSGE